MSLQGLPQTCLTRILLFLPPRYCSLLQQICKPLRDQVHGSTLLWSELSLRDFGPVQQRKKRRNGKQVKPQSKISQLEMYRNRTAMRRSEHEYCLLDEMISQNHRLQQELLVPSAGCTPTAVVSWRREQGLSASDTEWTRLKAVHHCGDGCRMVEVAARVYVCQATGLFHHCSGLCSHAAVIDDGFVCSLSGRILGYDNVDAALRAELIPFGPEEYKDPDPQDDWGEKGSLGRAWMRGYSEG
ncbi:MAG: uncharacterized protein KVP18_001416 [Porospora cf. gigantea A]|uniref:uncharacterized protein n=1 Tax=Porospora cf. gigantea A TaxID=2853593 RepID=UPI00355A0437|nr:MAG: hypothetical protein KVP18_001416 [Porospora cf. gigantea A]